MEYKIICKACKTELWSTKENPEYLVTLRMIHILEHLKPSFGFAVPKAYDPLRCPNCQAGLWPMGKAKFVEYDPARIGLIDPTPTGFVLCLKDTEGRDCKIDMLEIMKVLRSLAPDLMDKLWEKARDIG